jgi:hypothetical protein
MKQTSTLNAEKDYPQKACVLNCVFVELILIWKPVNVYQILIY